MDGIENSRTKEVVVVLPYGEQKVLMQLRDFNPEIIFSGCWAFFGGSINKGESPEEAAMRELWEEIGYRPTRLKKISLELELGYLLIHAFCCQLNIATDRLDLKEGLDFALFSLEEVIGGNLYSSRLKKVFPVAGTPYIINIIKKLFTKVYYK